MKFCIKPKYRPENAWGQRAAAETRVDQLTLVIFFTWRSTIGFICKANVEQSMRST